MQRKQLLIAILLLAICAPATPNDFHFQHPTQVALDHDGERWAQETLKKLSLEETIGQLFMIRILGQFVNSGKPRLSEVE